MLVFPPTALLVFSHLEIKLTPSYKTHYRQDEQDNPFRPRNPMRLLWS